MSVSPDEPFDGQDADLLARLATIFERRDPVPEGLVDRSLFALTLEGLHTEVAQLQRVDAPALALRGTADGGAASVEARTITFSVDSVTVLIALSVVESGAVRIDGWTAPATVFDIELYRPDGVTGSVSDDDGRFVIAGVPPGPASLVMRRADGTGRAVSTPVIDL